MISMNDFINKLKIVKPNEQLIGLLSNYRHLFAEETSQLKVATGVTHYIDTGDQKPIRQVPYRASPAEKKIIREQITDMLQNEIIEYSHSDWSSPIVLVTKKDAKIRFCVDYRKLNPVTVKDSHPLPLIIDTLDALNDSKIFTKLDLKSGYWSVSLDERTKHKTAFVSYMGLFQFKRLPFNLSDSPATFQRFLQHVLSDILWKFCLVYIDDIIIWSSNENEHVDHVRQVFERLDRHNLRLNPGKCDFATEEVLYLGHILTPTGVRPDNDKIRSVENFPKPKKVRNIREFLGLTSYYRRFVKDYAKIAKPLNDLLKKNMPFVWSNECEEAFEILKTKLITPPILGHFKPECAIILCTDASNYALGAILSQIQDDREVVISYNSKSLDERQSKYTVCEKEALAIVWAVNKLRHYIFGAHFTIKTDNCALCFLMKVKNPNGRLTRWSLLLSEYNFTIIYKSGALHRHCDCLSRNPTEDPDGDIGEFPFLLIEEVDIEGEQRNDSWCKEIIASLADNRSQKYTGEYKLENKILYKVSHDQLGNVILLLCAPKSLRRKILEELHCDVSAGHLGFLKTYVKVRNRFYWKRIEQSV